jgi:formylglycine-generating enzyme required for sulfatase activity
MATDPTLALTASEQTLLQNEEMPQEAPVRLVPTLTVDGSESEIRAPKSFAGWWAVIGMTIVVIAAAAVGIGPRIPPIDGAQVGLDVVRPVFEIGEVCSSGDDCTTERCSNGVCAPLDSSYVPEGSFEMGSSYLTPGGVPLPTADITFSAPLWVDSVEVTQAHWEQVMGSNPSRFLSCGSDCPVERVSWYDAIAFANARSIAEGLTPCYHSDGCTGEPGGGCPASNPDRCDGDFTCSGVSVVQICTGYRLPTEAEWEYAARAGAETSLPGGELIAEDVMASSSLDPTAWYGGNSAAGYLGAAYCSHWTGRSREIDRCGTHPVGFKPPNRWGLHDVIGSVSEWTGDGFMRLHEFPAIDPFGPLELPDRGVRGGAWSSFALNCRLGFRDAAPPTTRAANLGFRLVRSATQR